jgi:hypothetical protein
LLIGKGQLLPHSTGQTKSEYYCSGALWVDARIRRNFKTLITMLNSLGFLRQALLGLALINALIPLVDSLLRNDNAAPGWAVVPEIVCPVLAPIFVVVIFFDIVMSKVRAADAEGDDRAFFRRVARIEAIVIGLTLLYWVPFFLSSFR